VIEKAANIPYQNQKTTYQSTLTPTLKTSKKYASTKKSIISAPTATKNSTNSTLHSYKTTEEKNNMGILQTLPYGLLSITLMESGHKKIWYDQTINQILRRTP